MPRGMVIGRPTGLCAASGRSLETGETCIAVLARPLPPEKGADVEPSKGNAPVVERLDFTLDNWDSAWTDPGFKSRVLCWWRMVIPESGAPRKTFVDDSVLLDLFERLEEEEDEQRRAFRFVLGLILLRRRKLRMVGRESEEAVPVMTLRFTAH